MATTVAFSDLDTWLSNQPDNTVDTPYELEITGLTVNDIKSSLTNGSLGWVLRGHSSKFVELSSTIIPDGVTGMTGVFKNCATLVCAPVIPNGVLNLNDTFYNCTALTSAPVIPSSVGSMYETFLGCTSLATAPVIPSSVVDMGYTFHSCTSLTSAPVIPNNVNTLNYAFAGCPITNAPIIPNSVKTMNGTFAGCRLLTSAPVIPDSVTTMSYTFSNCVLITNAPVIPDSVTNMSYIFYNCSALTSAPIIPENVTNMYGSFSGCTSLTTAPVIPNSVTVMNGTFDGCTSLINAPIIPDSVTSMNNTFRNTNITYKPIIPDSVTYSTDCYDNVYSPNWKGTMAQVDSYRTTLGTLSQTDSFEVQIYDTDRVTLLDTVNWVDIANLSTWLSTQQDNTTDTPYKIAVSGIGDESGLYNNKSVLRNALRNNSTKFVDLFYTKLPAISNTSYRQTLLDYLLSNVSSLVVAPKFGESSSDYLYFNNTFKNCTNLRKVELPENYNYCYLYYTFYGCTSLKEVTIKSKISAQYGFYNCVSLEQIHIPILRNNAENAFYGCTSLKEIIIDNIESISTFRGFCTNCSSLEKLPILKGSVSNNCTMYQSFKGCVSVESIYNTTASPPSVSIWNAVNTPYTLRNDWSDSLENSYDGDTYVSRGFILPENIQSVTTDKILVTEEAYLDSYSSIQILHNTTTDKYYLSQSFSERYQFTLYRDVLIELQYATIDSNGNLVFDDTNMLVDDNHEHPKQIWTDSTMTEEGYFGGEIGHTAYYGGQYANPAFVGTYETVSNAIVLKTTKEIDYAEEFTIPTNVTNLTETFSGCSNLSECPSIPSSVTTMDSTFEDCTSITTPPTIPSSVTSLGACFYGCSNLESIPDIPSSVTTISSAFAMCEKASNTPTISGNSLTDMSNAFSYTAITEAPTIPSSVTNMNTAFWGCDSLKTVPNIPSSVTKMNRTFIDCTELETIESFSVPLNTLKNNSDFQYAFYNCHKLKQIGYKIEQSDNWHVFSLTIGGSTVEGTVYGVNENSQITTATIPSTSITKSSIRLPVLTDELWFPAGMSASEIEDAIEDMLTYKYGVFNKSVVPPDDKYLILWADEDGQGNAKVITNIGGGGGGGIDIDVVSASKTITPSKDKREIIDTASVVLTLDMGATSGVVVEVFAMAACSVTYYTAQSTSTTLSMASGTRAVFIYYNGWKYNGAYGAVWN